MTARRRGVGGGSLVRFLAVGVPGVPRAGVAGGGEWDGVEGGDVFEGDADGAEDVDDVD